MTRHTYSYYNYKTNELITNRVTTYREDFKSLGSRKVAEAFTSVSKEDRPKLWLSLMKGNGLFDLESLPSRIRHKLKKLNITKAGRVINYNPGYELLKKISKKK